MTALDICNLTVRYGGVVPIDDVTLQVDGGAWGLIGPNGAGKTTFFNVLSGFAQPVRGSIRAFSEDLLAMRPHRRARWGLRRTFQTEQAIRELSVWDNVLIGLEHSPGHRHRRSEVGRSIDFVGLTADARTPVAALDMYQRRLVELARAVVGQPRLVLLDEPAAGLPSEETDSIGRLISAIPDAFGATVIMVDHDMALVSRCCRQIAVLDFGKLIACGPTERVLSDPHVVAAYLGDSEAVS
jgi:branched-chain amino acid transport system ATP-binding protein